MMKGKITAIVALMLLLLTLGAEADVCKSHSKDYRGPCDHNTNCTAVCISEGNGGGACEGIIFRQCMCTHDCGSGDKDDGGGHPPAAEFTAGGRRAGGHA